MQFFLVVLQSFSLLCFMTGNKTLRFLASGDNGEGVGLGALTLDWYYIGGSVLVMPWWAIVNTLGSNIIWAWVITPMLFCTLIRIWFRFDICILNRSILHFPDFGAFGTPALTLNRHFADGTSIPVLNSVALFQNNGTRISAITMYDKTTFDLDEEVYASRAPIYITSMFAMLYAGNFLAVSSSISHVLLW